MIISHKTIESIKSFISNIIIIVICNENHFAEILSFFSYISSSSFYTSNCWHEILRSTYSWKYPNRYKVKVSLIFIPKKKCQVGGIARREEKGRKCNIYQCIDDQPTQKHIVIWYRFLLLTVGFLEENRMEVRHNHKYLL